VGSFFPLSPFNLNARTHPRRSPLLSNQSTLVVEIRPIPLIGIILVLIAIVIIIHPLCPALRMSLGFDLVVLVHALRFGELVDFAADEACEELFGEGVGDGFAFWGVSGVVVGGGKSVLRGWREGM
jgi:hypothetical protein